MSHLSHSLRLVCVVALCCLVGCASHPYQYPATAPRAEVAVSNEHPSSLTYLPATASYYPETRLAIMGPEKMQFIPFMGAGGALMMSAFSNTVPGVDRDKIAGKAVFDIPERLQSAINREVSLTKSERLFATTSEALPGTAKINIVTFGLVQFDREKTGVVGISARAYLYDAAGNELWMGELFARATGVRPLDGPEGWNAGNNLEKALAAAADRLAWGLVQLIGGDLDGGRAVRFSSIWSGDVGADSAIPGILAGENGDIVAIRQMLKWPSIYVCDRNELVITNSE